MTLALRRSSVLVAALLFVLTAIGLNAAPAQAADWRTVGYYSTKSKCKTVRNEFLRYYSHASICLHNAGTPYGWYFTYDRDS
jgi:hypothetical protein